MKKRDILIALLVFIGGVFHFKGQWETRFAPAQYTFFIFTVGMMASYLLYKMNKWMGYLGALFSFSFIKTALCAHAPMRELLEVSFMGGGMLLLYYMTRVMKLKEEALAFFLLPAFMNALLVIIQRFDNNTLAFMPIVESAGAVGFLGVKGKAGIYMAMCLPVFMKKLPFLVPIILLAIICTQSAFALAAAVVAGLFYIFFHNKKVSIALLIVILLTSGFIASRHKGTLRSEIVTRASMIVGSLDGVMHNPILGWGVGSFKPVMKRVPQRDSMYCGEPFSRPDGTRMRHPHNELVFGWWNCGLLYPVIVLCYLGSLVRKFSRDKLLVSSVILAGVVSSQGYFLSYPAWLMLIMALGIYENQEVKT